MSIDEELEEIEDLEMLYEDEKAEKNRPSRSSGCCLFTLCTLPFQILGFLIKSSL